MKVKLNINSNLNEEKAEFWINNLISISLRDAYIRLRRIYPAILLWLPEAPLLIIVN
ncbi:hypothetical protein [Lactobacillus amylovorus]|uniref:hypothetical protein n=1 Tax=Lactobacillus amylovorus TaxID=1604 RepID=UPI0036F2067F